MLHIRVLRVLCAATLTASLGCSATSESKNDSSPEGAGGKADDNSIECGPTVCDDDYLSCQDRTGDEDACLGDFASCLAALDLPIFECTDLPDQALEDCISCEHVSECDEVEDGADVTACNSAIARCQFDNFGLIPGQCDPPQPPPFCALSDCDDTYTECMVLNDDEDICTGAFASCLAVDGFATLSCEILPDEAIDLCISCEQVPECDVVEDGADANRCTAAVAACQFERFGSVPGDCPPPEPPQSCQFSGCTPEYLTCMEDLDDEAECGPRFAGCLADEGHPLFPCQDLPDQAQSACVDCETVPECDTVEDGADANACKNAQARCQFAEFGLLPGRCELPE